MNRFVKNYEILGPLGEGGMGTVYHAMDTELHREVALKCLRPDIANNPGVLERFRNEALAQAQLNHPNVAHLYAFFQFGPEYFMAMEYVNGATLSQVLHSRHRLSCEEAAGYGIQALKGLEHAHAHVPSIIHRDIKPANLMINGAGQLKVTDFGIARVSGASRATRAGMIVGTYEYISPEAAQGQPITALSDLYSMGVVLYEMIVGRLPFESTNEYELLKMHIQAPRPSIRSTVKEAPKGLDDAIRRAMDPSARRRFGSAGEMALTLEKCVGSGRKRATPGKSWFGSLLGSAPPDKEPEPIPAAADRRRADVSSTCHKIDDLLEQRLWDEAGSVLSAGLRSYPAEPDLLDLSNRLQRQRQQYDLGVSQQAELVRDLLQRGLPEAATKAASSALAAFPGAAILLDLQRECHQRADAVTQPGGELIQAQQRIEALIGVGKYQEAMDYLMELPGSNRNEGDLGKLLARIHRARKEAEKQEAIRRALSDADAAAAAGQWTQALSILDGALVRFPGDARIENLRKSVVERQAELQRLAVDALLAEVRELEQSVSLQAARDRLAKDIDSLSHDPRLVEELGRLDATLETARRETAIKAALADAAGLQSARRYQESLALLDRSAAMEGSDPRLMELRAAIAEDLRARQSEAVRRETAILGVLRDAAALRNAHRYQESLDLLDRSAAMEGPDQRIAELRAAIVEELRTQQSPVAGMAAEVERLAAAGEGTRADLLLIECRRRYPDHPEFIRLQAKVDAARAAEWDRKSREAGLSRAVAAIDTLLATMQVAEAATALEQLEREFGQGAAPEVAQKVASAVAERAREAERQRRAEEERNRARAEAQRRAPREPAVSGSGARPPAAPSTGAAAARPPAVRPRVDLSTVEDRPPKQLPVLSSPSASSGISKRAVALVATGVVAMALVGGWLWERSQTPVTPPADPIQVTPGPTPITQPPDDEQRNQVKDAIRARDWSKATELLARLPEDAEAQGWRKALSAGRAAAAAPGEQLFRLGDYEGAIAAFQRVLQVDRGNTYARNGLKRAEDARCVEVSVFGGGSCKNKP